MDLDIKEHKKNPLMKREEYEIKLDHSGKPTPSRQEIVLMLVKKLKSKQDLIIVDKIFTGEGKSISNVKALVFKKTNDIPKGKLEKMKAREKKKAKPAETETSMEKPAEPQAEQTETPKEEVNAEKPTEEQKAEEPREEAPEEKKEELTEEKPNKEENKD